MYFSDISKLKNITTQTRKQQKLKHLIVLFLRMLAIIFIVFALAGPELKKESAQQLSNSSTITIYVDNSYSMMAEGAAGRLFENARQDAMQVIDNSPDNSNFIIINNDNAGKLMRLISKEFAKSELEKLEISTESKKLSDILIIRNKILNNNNITSSNTYLFSDFQSNSTDISNLEIDSTSNYYFIPLKHIQNKNIYIDSCYINSSDLMRGSSIKLNVWVKNDSESDYEKVPLKLLVNNKQKAVAGIDIPAGTTKLVELNFTTASSGWHSGLVEIEDYPITFDDKMFFTFNIVPHIEILKIDGIVYNNDNNDYLSNFYNSDEVFNITSINYRTVDYSELGKYDLIILNELPDISSGALVQFKQYLVDGGNILFVPPLPEFSDYLSDFLSEMNAGLKTGIDTTATRVTSLKLSDKLFYESIKNIPQNAELPNIKQHYIYSFPTKSRVETLVSLLNGNDFLSVKKVGSGQLYLLSVGLNNQFGDFTSQLLFSPIMHGIASKRGMSNKLYFTLGEDYKFNISTGKIPTSETPISLVSIKTGQTAIPLQEIKKGDLKISLDNLVLDNGYYRVMSGDSLISLLAFNYNRNESEMSFYSAEKLNELCKDANILTAKILDVSNPDYKEIINALQKESDFWKLFIIFALSVILIEVLVLRFWK